eukprot:COSAG06_NODE_54892_length_292_cov_0.849741_1_plen_66_part_10
MELYEDCLSPLRQQQREAQQLDDGRLPPLPEGWECRQSRQDGTAYYISPSGVSQWDRPTDDGAKAT